MSTAAIDAEHKVLDAITAVLEEHRGLPMAELAKQTGFAVGRVQEVCRKSTCVLRFRNGVWVNDWSDCENDFRPAGRRRGRPRKSDGAVRVFANQAMAG